MFVLFIGSSEVVVIVLVVLLLFGAKSIPEFARTLGKAMHEFNKSCEDIKHELDHMEPEERVDKDVQQLIDADKQQEETPLHNSPE
ncbi:MAG: twin-arginine translocase TatA/TatE family subunit [Mangrovibacterium sp.]